MPTEARYLLDKALYHLPRLVRSRARRLLFFFGAFRAASEDRGGIPRRARFLDSRTPDTVKKNYDLIHQEQTLDFDRYVYGDPSKRDHVLLGGRVRHGSPAEARRLLLEHLEEVVRLYSDGVEAPLVIEVGSGNGRNLFHLKTRFPSLRLIGFDLSPVGVDAARKAAARFGLDVAFIEADATATFPVLPDEVTLIYSIHALEQMPRLFERAVDSMLRLRPRAAVFFEPVVELYPWSPRGCLSRARVIHMDYMRGLYRYLKKQRAPIVRARRLGFAQNPLNETCEIHVVRGS